MVSSSGGKCCCSGLLDTGYSFTFDELPEIANNCPDVVKAADEGKRWTAEEMYRASNYLIMEECHPMLFDLEVDKPELLPVD